MSGRFHNFAVAALAFGSLASALDPADPTITPPAVLARQNNNRFIGWVSTRGTWSSQNCDLGLTWYQNGNYAQCCATTLTGCIAPTACVNGNMIYPVTSLSTTLTIACTDDFNNKAYSICNTGFIFENMGDSSPQTDIVCGASAVNWSFYRAIPASATQSSTSQSSSAASVTSASLPGTTSSTSTSSSGSSGSTKKKKKSKAWIAGAVIGLVVGLALIVGAILAFLRRRKNKTVAPQQGGAAMGYDPSQPPAGVAGYTDAKPQFVPQNQPYASPTSPPIPQSYGQQPQHDPYAQQGAYGAQQAYAAAPLSPAPGYNQSTAYHAPSPGSPPPQQHEYYNQPEQKYGYQAAPNGAFELGGERNAGAPAVAPVASNATVPAPSPGPAQAQAPHAPHAVELGDSSKPGHQ